MTFAGDPAQAAYTFGSYARGTSYAAPLAALYVHVRIPRRDDYYRLLAILTADA